jgi:hypothetical protein
VTSAWSWLLICLGVSLVWLAWSWQCHQQPRSPQAAGTAGMARLLKPRTPDDCPVCRQQDPVRAADTPLRPATRPWREQKSRRGAPKRSNTQGFGCPNRRCAYYRITDTLIHALVGDGTDGRRERIQTFRCQACHTTFSARRDTPLYRLKRPSQRVGEVLTALAEGLDVAAAVRVFGHSEGTIMTWLARAGEHSATLHDRFFRCLQLPHVQLDEIRTRLRSRAHALWLWLAVDPNTKIIPALHHPEGTRATDPTCGPHSHPHSAPEVSP